MDSTYERLADLPLEVEGYALERRSKRVSPTFERVTTVVRLFGGGAEGLGEDVGYVSAAQEKLLAFGARLPLGGLHTHARFSDLLERLPLHPGELAEPKAASYRRWAFESAALDLALCQAGRSLGEALGRTPRPIRFVASLGLGRSPSAEPLRARREFYPELGFKLDATDAWSEALVEELNELGGVAVVDFKEHYGGKFEGAERKSLALYRRVAAGLPGALLEDCRVDDETRTALQPHAARLTWDAPFTRAADVPEFPFPPRVLNFKPSRFGTVRAVLDAYDRCEAMGVTGYGGGQFELGPGRAQIQTLASVFHPDAPNDVAPAVYNSPLLAASWPESPLPAPSGPGFGSGDSG
jgi:hypothetical protein